MACSDCVKPASFWEGSPRGKEVELQGTDAYVAEPSKTSKKTIILIPDVFGWEAKNTRLLVDKFASVGFIAVLPGSLLRTHNFTKAVNIVCCAGARMGILCADWFHGDKPDIGALQKGDYSEFSKWRARHGDEQVIPEAEKVLHLLAKPQVLCVWDFLVEGRISAHAFAQVISSLKSMYGVSTVGVIGFCWGGRFAAILGSGDKVNAVVLNHGSFVERENIEALKQPVLINGSDNDKQISREKLAQFTGILECNKDVLHDVKLFEGAEHGWTCRGDAADPKIGPQIVEAHERAASWFQKHL